MISLVETKLFTRVIYFLRTQQRQIWMFTLYPKNVADSIPAHVLRQIKEEIDD